MKNKFTKGPWKIDPKHKGLIVSGNQMIAVSWIDHMNLVTPTEIQSEENEANLTLIAAAPEMLEALVAVFQARAPCLNFDFEGHPDMLLLETAIRKARGEK